MGALANSLVYSCTEITLSSCLAPSCSDGELVWRREDRVTCLMERNCLFCCLHHISHIFLPALCLVLSLGTQREALRVCFSTVCSIVTCQVLHRIKLLVGLRCNWVAEVPKSAPVITARWLWTSLLHRAPFTAGDLWQSTSCSPELGGFFVGVTTRGSLLKTFPTLPC